MPYGHQQFSPEFAGFATSLKGGSFPEDVGDVIAEDLRAAGAASWVGTPEDRLPGPGASARAYRLHVTVEQGIYHRNVTTYGLSLAGAVLWFVGLPVSYGSAEMAISAELRDPKGNSRSDRARSDKSSGGYRLAVP